MPRPLQVDLWPFDLESGVRVSCDVGYLCANFSLPTPLCSWLRPDVRDRQTDVRRQTSDAHHRLMLPTLGAGHNKCHSICCTSACNEIDLATCTHTYTYRGICPLGDLCTWERQQPQATSPTSAQFLSCQHSTSLLSSRLK